MPIEASFIREGTIAMALSAVRMMVGSIKIESAMPPAIAE